MNIPIAYNYVNIYVHLMNLSTCKYDRFYGNYFTKKQHLTYDVYIYPPHIGGDSKEKIHSHKYIKRFKCQEEVMDHSFCTPLNKLLSYIRIHICANNIKQAYKIFLI